MNGHDTEYFDALFDELECEDASGDEERWECEMHMMFERACAPSRPPVPFAHCRRWQPAQLQAFLEF